MLRTVQAIDGFAKGEQRQDVFFRQVRGAAKRQLRASAIPFHVQGDGVVRNLMPTDDVKQRVDLVGPGERDPAALDLEFPSLVGHKTANRLGASTDNERPVELLVDQQRALNLDGGLRANQPDVPRQPDPELRLQDAQGRRFRLGFFHPPGIRLFLGIAAVHA